LIKAAFVYGVLRGDERVQDGMYSYVSLERRVPGDHPLRGIRELTDEVLRSRSGEFDVLYSEMGRRSIAGVCAAGVAVAGFVLGPIGAAAG
jgi:hypothetical protein